ncbi:hypothetical protein GTQ40_05340 [Flavobacteriaceae bacterium R38]|nr:hypothetical protein [Flavobacteriaceae bacterium R38]
MKKQSFKNLKLNKKLISKLDVNSVVGGTGVSGACTSSLIPLQCVFACATQETVCASLEC